MCGVVRPLSAHKSHFIVHPSQSSRFVRLTFLPECERVQRDTALNADVLLSVDHEGDWTGGNRWPEVCLPQQPSIPRIERDELTVAPASEQHVGLRRENS